MKKATLLLVDDTPSNIRVLNGILQDDYRIVVATNGPDALSLAASENRPDLILLDIMMPDMDGYEVCRQLKASPQTQKIPLIFVTAKGEDKDESKGFAIGCVDYIKRPVSPPIVLARVQTHLKLSQALEKLETQNIELEKAARLREEVERIARHDLKNPLTGVFSGVELIEMIPGLSHDHIEALDIIKEASLKMLGMINGSLDIFKMEQGMYQVRPVEVNIINTIRSIEKELRSLVYVKKSRLSILMNDTDLSDTDSFNIRGEPLLVYAMLSNLIKNAFEAVKEKEWVSVYLSIEGNVGVIRIHNPGTVHKSVRDKFFEKYATAGKKRGTGLGTYSAKLIARVLGGDIGMSSSGEEGTSVYIRLPVSKGDTGPHEN
ncbi:MAG TPA: hybrid sensor histidine kinase/response regulator [Desulfobacteraceae bacterium]|nr:hybrid sensor histidine kinase/response regulator [Desulfobacteraceae bacterium]